MTTIKNLGDIRRAIADGTIRQHHCATYRAYVSRTGEWDTLPAVPYNGRFGRGFYVLSPRYDTTTYCHITYYIFTAGGADND